MDDLISRQAAIDAVTKALDRETLLNSFVRKVAVDAVKALPSAERRGRWTNERTMEHDGDTYCDQCGWTWDNLTFDRTKVKRSPFCPNCGADMREVEE